MTTPATQARLDHAGHHWAQRRHGGPLPPPRPTPAMRTRMHEELHRLLTTGCTWCMAANLDRLRGLLEALQADVDEPIRPGSGLLKRCPGCPACTPCETCGKVGGGGTLTAVAYPNGEPALIRPCPSCGGGTT